jgi:signal transduction histidine kinase
MELQRLGLGNRDTTRRALDALDQGRWSLAPDQADYFSGAFGRSPRSHTPLAARTAFARALAREWQPPTSVGQPQPSWLAATGTQLFQLRQTDGTTVGVAVDAMWVRRELLPRTAVAVAPAAIPRVLTMADEGAPLKRAFPGWRIALDFGSVAVPLWRRGEVVAFAATTAVVLGLLVLGVVLLLRDVARRSALNRLRADLVSGVSHELKAPLSVIRVYAETLAQAGDATPGDRVQFAEAILQETDRLHRAIGDVVDFSRIEQGERTYRKAPTAMRALLDTVAQRFREYASLHGFRLRTELAPDLPVVTVDPAAVEQAVHNLLDNACKYSGDAREIDLYAARRDGHVIVEVRDSGIGIAPEDQARMFQRFQRGQHADRGGYGLGLYLVRHIMDAHGGTIEVESSPGAGSRFTLKFPVEGAHAEGPAHRG